MTIEIFIPFALKNGNSYIAQVIHRVVGFASYLSYTTESIVYRVYAFSSEQLLAGERLKGGIALAMDAAREFARKNERLCAESEKRVG